MRTSMIIKSAIFIVFLFTAAENGVSEDMTIIEILKKHTEALGGLENISKIRSIYTSSRVKAGELTEILVKTTVQIPDKYLSQADMGAYQEISGFDGTKAWKVDNNGKISVQGKNELEDAITNCVIASYTYLNPGSSIKIVNAGEKTEQEKKYICLEIHPQGGSQATLYIDPVTFLTAVEIRREQNLTIKISYDDYRKFEGVMVPYKSMQTIMEMGITMNALIEEISFNKDIDPLIFQLPRQDVKDYKFTVLKEKTPEIDFELDRNLIFLKNITIDGKGPYEFILDSGAGKTVLSQELAVELGLEQLGKMPAGGVGGVSEVSVVNTKSIALPGVELLNQEIVCMDFANLEKALGRKFQGILGYDGLSRFIVKLDYENGKLTFFNPEEFVYKGNGEIIEADLTSNIFTVFGIVNDKFHGNFLVDTGSTNFLDLLKHFVSTNSLQPPDSASTKVKGTGAGGEELFAVAPVKSFQVGSIRIAEPLAGFPAGEKGVYAAKEIAGNIGNEFLKMFTVILDYRNKKIIFEKNKNFHEKFESKNLNDLKNHGQ